MTDRAIREAERKGDRQKLAVARWRANLCPWCGDRRCEGFPGHHPGPCCCCSACYHNQRIREAGPSCPGCPATLLRRNDTGLACGQDP